MPRKKTKSQAQIKKMWHRKAWSVFSTHIRKKYADWKGYVACSTCKNVKHWKEMHAGHFRHDAYDFEEWNIHPQCAKCNTFEHGRGVDYFAYMIKMYGYDIAEQMRTCKKWNAYTLKQLQEIYEKYKED